ncbi:uroporphyrinogen-III synthase [Listeria weihenstephanensis]|uniref:Uroporphyrinogen-III synthase n=1 Tax=Listeria weihenstephanensis TaxID=1006155 RepID=A0A841Z503_9LIST|nr:uroporphyrinogen-III synthase [Listeria weihenstephanensis]MBC1500288.1 uroporphyrinogen-III synthase [Listeria weihenstephanensis]
MAKHVLLTREESKNKPWSTKLMEAGFTVSEVPMIETKAIRAEILVHAYDWIIFTSANTVHYYFQMGGHLPKSIKIAVIGEKTADELKYHGYSADFQPTLYTTDVFIVEWLNLGMEPQRVLIPKSSMARSEIAKCFSEQGHDVTENIIYETGLPEHACESLQKATSKQSIDVAIFASPSAWNNFVDCYQEDISKLTIASIGPVTTDAIRKSGFSVLYEPENYTMEQICQQLIEGEL